MADLTEWVTPEWPPAQIRELLRLNDEGLSCRLIAAALGVTRNAALGKLHRMGVHIKSGLKGSENQRPRPSARMVGRVQRALAPHPHAKPPRPLPPVVTAAPRGSVHWLERGFGECAWPIAGAGADTISCCAPCDGEKVYCAKHCAVAYVAPKNVGGDFARSLRWYTR